MHLVNLTVLFAPNKNIPIIRREKFSGEIIKVSNCSLTLFSSGKIIATRKHSYEKKIELVTALLKDRNFEGEIESSKIINIVFTSQITLATLWSEATRLSCFTYEPELFPSCIWRRGNAIISLFTSGKYIITGVQSTSAAYKIEQDFLKEISCLL